MNAEPGDLAERDRIRRAADGDLEAMEKIYSEHRTMAYAVGMAVCKNATDADDVVQETFLRAFRSLAQWRAESPFRSWLYAVALRTAQNWKSRFVNRRVIPSAAVGAGISAPEAPRDDEHARVLAAVRELPEQQRLTLLLKHLRGFSVREIAELQGCAEGTVKANLHHAVQNLARRLGKGIE
jgi:RNA polymerase sigma-70 factor, ECF subfamily